MSAGGHSTDSSNDPFGRVVGTGRGLSNVAASQEQLREMARALADAAEKLEASETHAGDLQATIDALQSEVANVTEQRKQAQRWAKQAEASESDALIERDRARYAAMRNGQADPCGHVGRATAHQGFWTPGRPYLAYQHAWHPRTKECYRACSSGAPAGEMPGTGRHWGRCLDSDACPSSTLLVC